MTDLEASAAVLASSWETLCMRCEEHRRAKAEFEEAYILASVCRTPEAEIRLLCAHVALDRAEGRLRR